MNVLRIISMAMMAVLLSMSFAACSSDDDEAVDGGNDDNGVSTLDEESVKFVGTWEMTNTKSSTRLYQFREDGNVYYAKESDYESRDKIREKLGPSKYGEKGQWTYDAETRVLSTTLSSSPVYGCGSIFEVLSVADDFWTAKQVSGESSWTWTFTRVTENSYQGVVGTEDISLNSVASAVDLGLSVKWANHNLGAKSETQYGGYFVWGDPTGKINPGDENYIKSIDFPKKICGTQYDIAHVQWGGKWRLPTIEELSELKSKCTWTKTTKNNVKGVEVKGPNGKTIFLPFAGYTFSPVSSADFHDLGEGGNIWSGEGTTTNAGQEGYYMDFDNGYPYQGCNGASSGFSVRPVSE